MKDKINEYIGNKIDQKKNEVKDNLTPESVKNAKQNIQNASKITKNVANGMRQFAIVSYNIITNPISWIGLGALAFGVVAISAMTTWGPTSFSQVCQANGAPDLYELADESEKLNATADYLSRPGIKMTNDLVTSSYLSILVNEGDFSYSNQNNCDLNCLETKLNNGENVELGALKLKGDHAKALINTAKQNGKDWTDTSVQLSAIKSTLANVPFTENSEDNAKLINDLYGINKTSAELKSLLKDSKDLSEKVEENPVTCKSLGDGKGKSRLGGGGGKKSGSKSGTPGWIFDEKYILTSPYWTYFGGGTHRGVDLVCESGEGCPMYAVASGEVIVSDCTSDTSGPANGFSPACMVVIQDDENGHAILYAHNVNGSHTVEVGDKVEKGDEIAQMGNTGWSTGPHLHFQVNEQWGTDSHTNPWEYMCGVKDPDEIDIRSGKPYSGMSWDPKEGDC